MNKNQISIQIYSARNFKPYEKIFKFVKEIDNVSLSTGKSININLIKKVLHNE